MTIKNGDMPSMPTTCRISNTNEAWAFQVSGNTFQVPGLTKREMFCLHMGVAETGDEELDSIIRKGNQQKMAEKAMAAIVNAATLNGSAKEGDEAGPIVMASVFVADALLAELERTK